MIVNLIKDKALLFYMSECLQIDGISADRVFDTFSAGRFGSDESQNILRVMIDHCAARGDTVLIYQCDGQVITLELNRPDCV